MRRSGRLWAGSGTAPERGGRIRVRGGARAGGEGELLAAGRGGRVRVPVPDAGSAQLVPLGLEAAARRAGGARPGGGGGRGRRTGRGRGCARVDPPPGC